MMRVFVLMMFGLSLLGQQYIDNILDLNPFDPERGQEEDVEPEEPVILDRNLPTLDGTLIIGELRYALFSLMEEGLPASKRIPLNGMVGGYKLVNVDRSFVELDGGSGAFKVAMYSGDKKNRGGSKAASKVAKSNSKKSEPTVISTESEESKSDSKANAKAKPSKTNKGKTRFRTRTDPAKREKTARDNKF